MLALKRGNFVFLNIEFLPPKCKVGPNIFMPTQPNNHTIWGTFVHYKYVACPLHLGRFLHHSKHLQRQIFRLIKDEFEANQTRISEAQKGEIP